MTKCRIGRTYANGLVIVVALAAAGCGSDGAPASKDKVSNPICAGDAKPVVRPDNWSVESHCPGVLANYAEVFDPTVVRRFDITISAADYEATLQDLRDNAANATGDLDSLPTPIEVDATVAYNSKVWTHVGMRWKGHASLKGAWLKGVRKLSFALDFNHFEETYPELRSQHFFGFKKLNFGNAYNDPSAIRDKTAGDVFRAAGVPMAKSSFAAVYMDVGEGPVYRGLYTIIEDPADKMLADQLKDGSGNLYKPHGDAARWLSLTEIPGDTVKTYFEKQTNETTSDWTDVGKALNALHADRTDVATWRKNLEAVFDVPAFLRVIAVNQVMVNWDSYGCMHHNYLVYGNPLHEKRLQWMPWDLNEAMLATENATCPPPGSVMLDEIVNGDPTATTGVDANWPLIRFILGDATYKATYVGLLTEVLTGAFAAEPLIAQMRADHDLIAPYIVGPIAEEKFPNSNTTATNFNNSLTTGANALEPHVAARHQAVQAAITAFAAAP